METEESGKDLPEAEGVDCQEAVSIAGGDSSSETEVDEPASKKTKILPNITAYIDIISPARSTKVKESTISRGPFFFTTETTHQEFLRLLAAACADDSNTAPNVASINQAVLLWKLNVPANDKKKPLANGQGYQAMIGILSNRLTEKSKDSTITLIMPPLLKNTNAVCIFILQLLYTYKCVGVSGQFRGGGVTLCTNRIHYTRTKGF